MDTGNLMLGVTLRLAFHPRGSSNIPSRLIATGSYADFTLLSFEFKLTPYYVIINK